MTSPFVLLRKPVQDGPRLFCFPYAGGGASAFRDLAAVLPPRIEPVAIRLPGRESRFGERPYDRMEQVLAHLLTALPPWLDRPYACFGYSMGARVALALLQAAQADGLLAPAALLVGGSPGPSLPLEVPGWNNTNEELIARLRDLGGIPPEVQADPELLNMMLPTVRADLDVVATWRHRHNPIATPIHALAGVNDDYASPTRMRAWAKETRDQFHLTAVPGDHFFLHTKTQLVSTIISNHLNPIITKSESTHTPTSRLRDG